MKYKWVGLVALLALSILFWGCEGPEGPQGEQGDDGAQGPMNPGYTYLGDNGNTCGHCHGDVAETWMETGHHEAYDALSDEDKTNLYCVQCHVTGFDAEVAYGDTIVVTPGPDMYGFDDYWPPVTDEDEMRVAALEGVQCESCHGSMGPTIYDHSPIVNFNGGTFDSTDPSMCSKCHEQVEEWQESGHGMVFEVHELDQEGFDEEWNRSSCGACHTGEGFMGANDPNYPNPYYPEDAHLITCQACHDPHDNGNASQLRNLDDFTVVYDLNEAATFTGYGTAQICGQCHHARRDSSNVAGQIADGSNHFGPHGSPQMDLFVGSGSYEIDGYTYDRDHAHMGVEESCVTCHMEQRSHSDPLGWKGGHDFDASEATCSSTGCHSAAPPEGWDYGGTTTEINGKLDQIIALLGVPADSVGYGTVTTPEQRMAAYAWQFVVNDGSHGVHNPTYANSLLDNAIDHLQNLAAQQQAGLAQK